MTRCSGPTGPLCDGCHSVNYDIETKTVTEWNVGCERCHGAGSAHVTRQEAPIHRQPGQLDYVRANDVCIQCHSQGQPLTNPDRGPILRLAGRLSAGGLAHRFWRLEEHQLGKETLHALARRHGAQEPHAGQRLRAEPDVLKGVRCYTCHDTHGTKHEADLRCPGNAVCLQCHGPVLQPGPRGTIEFHTQHAADSEGSKCVACHMPKIEQTIANVNVRSHTFKFISPAMSERHGMPNPCTTCHKDKSNEWAMTPRGHGRACSPWRVAQ